MKPPWIQDGVQRVLQGTDTNVVVMDDLGSLSNMGSIIFDRNSTLFARTIDWRVDTRQSQYCNKDA